MLSHQIIKFTQSDKATFWEFSSPPLSIALYLKTHIIVSESNNSLLLLDRSNGNCERYVTLDHPITALKILHDNMLACGHLNGEISFWTLPALKLELTIPGDGENSICSLAQHKNNHLVAGYRNGAITIWDFKGRARINTDLEQYGSATTALTISPKTDEIISGHKNGVIQFWHPGNRQRSIKKIRSLSTLLSATDSFTVKALAAFPDGRIISGDISGRIKMWGLDRELLFTCEAKTAIHSITPKSSDYFMSATSNHLEIWSSRTGLSVIRTKLASSMVSEVDEDEQFISSSETGIHILHYPSLPLAPEAKLESKSSISSIGLTIFSPSSEKKYTAKENVVVINKAPEEVIEDEFVMVAKPQ